MRSGQCSPVLATHVPTRDVLPNMQATPPCARLSRAGHRRKAPETRAFSTVAPAGVQRPRLGGGPRRTRTYDPLIKRQLSDRGGGRVLQLIATANQDGCAPENAAPFGIRLTTRRGLDSLQRSSSANGRNGRGPAVDQEVCPDDVRRIVRREVDSVVRTVSRGCEHS